MGETSMRKVLHMTDDEIRAIIERDVEPNYSPGIGFWFDEYNRRETRRYTEAIQAQTETMVRATLHMRNLTWAVAIITVISAACTVYSLFRPVTVIVPPNPTSMQQPATPLSPP